METEAMDWQEAIGQLKAVAATLAALGRVVDGLQARDSDLALEPIANTFSLLLAATEKAVKRLGRG